MTLTRNSGRELPSYIATTAVADSYSHYKNWDLEDGSVTPEHCLVFLDSRWPIILSALVQLCMCVTQRRPSTLPVPLQLHEQYCKWYMCTSPGVILLGAPLYGNSTQPHQIMWHTRIMTTLHTSKMITDRFAYHASTVYNNTAQSDTHLLWIMVFLVRLLLTFKFPSNVYECLPLHTATTNIQLFETFPDCKLWESWLGLHLDFAENVSISYDITVLVCCLAT